MGAGAWEPCGDDAINAPAVVAGSQIRALAQLLGHPLGVLDDLAVHIDDVERAVGTDFQVHGRAPLVARSEEFDAFEWPAWT